MIKWRGQGISNRTVLGFGLSDDNIDKIKGGDPIYFNLQQLGSDLPDVDVTIGAGETERAVRDELEKHVARYHAALVEKAAEGEYNIVDVSWWTSSETVGVVVIRTTVGSLKAYIGSGKGLSEDGDAQWIAANGSRMHNEAVLKAMFPALKDEEWYKG